MHSVRSSMYTCIHPLLELHTCVYLFAYRHAHTHTLTCAHTRTHTQTHTVATPTPGLISKDVGSVADHVQTRAAISEW